MAESILYSEVSAVCILILLLLCIKVRNSMFLQEQRRLFLRVAISNILFLALDSVWIFIDRQVLDISVALNWGINGCYYILSGVLGVFWFTYSETVQGSRLVQDKRYRPVTLLPVAILIILTLLSFKTGWLFYIDAQNTYHRGPAYPIQLLTSYGYVIFTAGKAFYLSRHTDNYRRQVELRALAAFVLPTLVAGTLQVIFPGYPILCIGNAVGILYVYLTLQEQLISRDPLTKLNNRNQLFQYLSMKITHLHEKRDLYLLMIDVDYFKTINDQYGHVEGDQALKIVADCLMKSCGKRNFFIARYGGDEFVVLCELGTADDVQEVRAAIHAEMEKVKTPYVLSLSIGCAKYTAAIKNQQDFIAQADAELYKIKNARSPKKTSRVGSGQ